MAKAKVAAPEVDGAEVVAPAALVPVRVLVDSAFGKCNTLAHIPADQVASAAGVVDSTPEAVAAVTE